jgi:hypothetical protein
MAISKTSFHAGEVIRALLLADEDVTAITTRIFPIVADEATLPYIVYRRSETVADITKSKDSDTTTISIDCLAETYQQSVELAEAVRRMLNESRYDGEDLKMRSCAFIGSDGEDWQDDAFIQNLKFRLKIN